MGVTQSTIVIFNTKIVESSVRILHHMSLIMKHPAMMFLTVVEDVERFLVHLALMEDLRNCHHLLIHLVVMETLLV